MTTLDRRASTRFGASPRAKLYSVKALAELWDVSEDTVRQRLSLPGAPKPVDLPGDARYREAEIEEWLDALV